MTIARRTPNPSALSVLRSLVPDRRLSPVEARFVIEQQANRLLQLAEITSPPVSLEAVVAVLPRVMVRYVRRLETSGRSEWTGITWLILIDAREPLTRQRFTLAHEIGHIVYHPLRSTVSSAGGTRGRLSRMEAAVSYFAACLLMPRPWLKQTVTITGNKNVDSLAQLFEVSDKAIARRLIELAFVDPLELKQRGEAS